MTRVSTATARFAFVAVATALAAGSGAVARASTVALTVPLTPRVASVQPATRAPHAPAAVAALAVPARLTALGLGLRAPPVAVPLLVEIPSIGVRVSVLGVGVTAHNAMDAPEGGPDDPVWQQAFWYRGSAVPGAASTALIAGHIDDPRGRPGSFANIDRLRRGDVIVVHDTRTGLDVRFAVTGSESFPLDTTRQPAVLTRIYGAGPVAGTTPQPSTDGLAHLTLVTCAGTFQHSIGTHDHRLAVFATRIA